MSLQDLLLQHTIFDLRYTSSETTVHTGNTQTLKKIVSTGYGTMGSSEDLRSPRVFMRPQDTRVSVHSYLALRVRW